MRAAVESRLRSGEQAVFLPRQALRGVIFKSGGMKSRRYNVGEHLHPIRSITELTNATSQPGLQNTPALAQPTAWPLES